MVSNLYQEGVFILAYGAFGILFDPGFAQINTKLETGKNRSSLTSS